MKIKELNKPKLKTVKMLCDEIINPKLINYPMVEDCFSKTNFTLIIGKTGSGKTSLATSFVKQLFKKCYEYIYIIIPEASLNSLADNIFTKNLPPDQIYNDLTEDILEEIYLKFTINSDHKENSLLIIDDFQNCFKSNSITIGLEKIINKIRHLRTTVILLQQNYLNLPKRLRLLTYNIITFDIGKIQLESIFNEHVELKKDQYDEIIKLIFTDKYSWMCVNTRSKKIYKEFDLIEM
jgi:Cdc6-like AAA superfamily ATPase